MSVDIELHIHILLVKIIVTSFHLFLHQWRGRGGGRGCDTGSPGFFPSAAQARNYIQKINRTIVIINHRKIIFKQEIE